MRREWKHERGKENGGRGEGLRPGVKLFLKESMDIGEGVECEGRWGGHGKVMTRVWREEVAFKQGHRVDCREGEGRPRLADNCLGSGVRTFQGCPEMDSFCPVSLTNESLASIPKSSSVK